jgi:hypothetical protein
MPALRQSIRGLDHSVGHLEAFVALGKSAEVYEIARLWCLLADEGLSW